MNSIKPKHFPLKATTMTVTKTAATTMAASAMAATTMAATTMAASAMAVLLTVGSSMAIAEGVSDQAHTHDNDTLELSWQETKRNAADYWQDFKQDSKQTWGSSKDAFRDGWIEGKLETAIILSSHLNPFDIDISVDNNTATLEGQVDSAVQKELASQLALGIEGIDEVNNTLKVEKGEKTTDNKKMDHNQDQARKFGTYVEDTVLTADLKTDLIASDTISALAINVDVNRAEVTLTGNVGSQAEKDLAEKIVKNNPDVKGVNNHLKIES